MRKIETKLRAAIEDFRPFSKQNTVFCRMPGTKDGWMLFLHGNHIASFDAGGNTPTIPTAVSFAGYPTPTTRSRLNCLDGVNIQFKNRIPYLNGKEIDSVGWYDPKNPM